MVGTGGALVAEDADTSAGWHEDLFAVAGAGRGGDLGAGGVVGGHVEVAGGVREADVDGAARGNVEPVAVAVAHAQVLAGAGGEGRRARRLIVRLARVAAGAAAAVVVELAEVD